MPRDVPSAQTQALQKIQLQSMRERLKLDSARARQAVADAPSAEKLGPMGRPVVRYKDMPALDDTDMDFMAEEFHRMACPHVAVLEYRPGYGERGYTPEVARECWWFFERGMDILFAVADAVLSERMPDLFTQLSTEELDVSAELLTIVKHRELQVERKIKAAMQIGLSDDEFAAKTETELADIRKDVEARYEEMHTRREER